MESAKVKELKDDAILNIKVNKTFYLMTKSALFSAFKTVYDDSKISSEEFVKALVSKDYKDMSEQERNFYTLTLLVGEIEKQAVENNLFEEKEYSQEELKEKLSAVGNLNKD